MLVPRYTNATLYHNKQYCHILTFYICFVVKYGLWKMSIIQKPKCILRRVAKVCCNKDNIYLFKCIYTELFKFSVKPWSETENISNWTMISTGRSFDISITRTHISLVIESNGIMTFNDVILCSDIVQVCFNILSTPLNPYVIHKFVSYKTI